MKQCFNTLAILTVACQTEHAREVEGRYRRVPGPRWEIGKTARGVAQDRGPSQICRLERVAGCGVIASRRSNSAHLHRPWRASPADDLTEIERSVAAAVSTHCRTGAITPKPRTGVSTPGWLTGQRVSQRFGNCDDWRGQKVERPSPLTDVTISDPGRRAGIEPARWTLRLPISQMLMPPSRLTATASGGHAPCSRGRRRRSAARDRPLRARPHRSAW